MINIKKLFWIFTLLYISVLWFSFIIADEINGNLNNWVDQWLNVSLPCSPVSVSNGNVNSTTCEITCNSNYDKSGNSCVLHQSSWWGGWWSTLSKDDCPNGDKSGNYYDNKCNAPVTNTWTNNTWNNDTQVSSWTQNEIDQFKQDNQDKPFVRSLEAADYTDEFKDAYLFAYMNWITTKETIEEAKMDITITRAEMAKMMSQYAMNVLDKVPDTNKVCTFSDIWDVAADLQDYIKTACQLSIMGINADWTLLINFNPYGLVTRAQFATVLSRILRGDRYNLDAADYYRNHIQALKAEGIIANDDPTLQELRWYVMLMLMRSF